MIPNISKLYHAGFKVYRVAEDNSIYRLIKHPVTRSSAAYRFDWTQVSIFRSKAGVKREMDKLLKDPMSVAIDYNDRNRNDNIGEGSVIVCTREPNGGYYTQKGYNGILGWGTSIEWVWTAGSFPDWYPRESN